MEDILASIRRILSEDEVIVPPAAGSAPLPPAARAPAPRPVLILDETMLVQPPPEPAAADPAPPAAEDAPSAGDTIAADLARMLLAQEIAAAPAHAADAPIPEPPAPQILDSNMPDLMTPESSAEAVSEHAPPPPAEPGSAEPGSVRPGSARPDGPLVAPESAAATQSVVSALMRQLSTERATPVYRAGPTLEDLVREEMRPLLKHWLDTHLPPMVERLVRGELDRLIARAAP